ncbi:unnamed protein product [Protopolystoma xenopodis]|uniref:dihydropyrimidinase n=1 Tax=Protopolystoma xenopodis TaxID=117903 RepID=A0A448WUI6_9PLAT|nr:unnamed protein product [Protopolystoma xenopodis]
MFEADLYIEDGIIKQIGTSLMIPGGVRTLEAKGKLIFPGGVDTNTHMQMPFMDTVSSDDFYSGTKAALAGGTTTIIDFVYPKRGASIVKAFEQFRECADSKVCCDYTFHVVIPHYDEKVASEMEILVKEKGINSFMAYLAYPGVFMLEEDELLEAMECCKRLGALILVHAENGKLIEKKQDEVFNLQITGPEGHLYSRPEASEVEAANRVITYADSIFCPLYITSVSSTLVAQSISEARRNGALVWGEALIAALAVDGSHCMHPCWWHSAAHVVSPPLRPLATNASKKLMHCLANGDLECTGSNHCVFRAQQKALGKDDFRKIPHGLNGVEDRMSVLWEKGVVSGLLDPCKFVAVTSTNAAKIFNLYPRKGRIDTGSDADIVIWDPESEKTISSSSHHQNVELNIFEGMQIHGDIWMVISGGRVVLEDGELRVSQGAGRFLATQPFSHHIYGRVQTKENFRKLSYSYREPYSGPFLDVNQLASAMISSISLGDSENSALLSDPNGDPAFSGHIRPPTRSGGRHMQDSTFSLSDGIF